MHTSLVLVLFPRNFAKFKDKISNFVSIPLMKHENNNNNNDKGSRKKVLFLVAGPLRGGGGLNGCATKETKLFLNVRKKSLYGH